MYNVHNSIALEQKLRSLRARERKTSRVILVSSIASILVVSFAIATLLFGFSQSRGKLIARSQELDRLQQDLTLRNQQSEKYFAQRTQEYETEATNLRNSVSRLQEVSHDLEAKLSTARRQKVDLGNGLNQAVIARREARDKLDEIIAWLMIPRQLPGIVDSQLNTLNTLSDQSSKLDLILENQERRLSDLNKNLVYISGHFENNNSDPNKIKQETQTSLSNALKLFQSLQETKRLTSTVQTELSSVRTDPLLINTVNDYQDRVEYAKNELRIFRAKFIF